MKIFPSKKITLELIESIDHSFELLKLNTLESTSLTTKSTNKKFIGRIDKHQFEIISSEDGIGAFTILKGEFLDDSVTIVAEINMPFKVLISSIFLVGLTGIFYSFFSIGLPEAVGMLIPLALLFFLIKFIFLGKFFHRSLNSSLEKFTEIIKCQIKH